LYVLEAVLADDESLTVNELGVNLVYSSDQFLSLLNTYNVLMDGEIRVSVMSFFNESFLSNRFIAKYYVNYSTHWLQNSLVNTSIFFLYLLLVNTFHRKVFMNDLIDSIGQNYFNKDSEMKM